MAPPQARQPQSSSASILDEAIMSALSQGSVPFIPDGLNTKRNATRPKKEMQFQSREHMLKYIENFRVNYKTEMCKNWVHTAKCEFEQECSYAHGYHELQQKPTAGNRNYKTKLCKKWHK